MLKNATTTLRRYLPRSFRRLLGAVWGVTSMGLSAVMGYAAIVELVGGTLDKTVVFPVLILGGLSWMAAIVAAAFLGITHQVQVALEERGNALILRIRSNNKEEKLDATNIRYVLRDGGTLWIGKADGQIFEIQNLSNAHAATIQKNFGRPAFALERRAPPRLGLALTTMMAVVVVAGFTTGLFGVAAGSPIAVYLGAIVGGWTGMFQRAKQVVVGIDGLRVGKDFIAFQDLARILSRKNRLVIVKSDGSEHRYRVPISSAQAAALDQTLRVRMEATASQGEAFGLRAGESAGAWIRRLRAIFETQAFRTAAKTKEDAKVLLRSPKVPLRVRVGVAAALADSDPQLVKSAIADVSDPRMIRLAQAAIEGEAALLEELEFERSPATRSI